MNLGMLLRVSPAACFCFRYVAARPSTLQANLSGDILVFATWDETLFMETLTTRL